MTLLFFALTSNAYSILKKVIEPNDNHSLIYLTRLSSSRIKYYVLPRPAMHVPHVYQALTATRLSRDVKLRTHGRSDRDKAVGSPHFKVCSTEHVPANICYMSALLTC